MLSASLWVPPHIPLAFNVLSGRDWVVHAGTLGIILVIFAETGLLLGVFLPGDSLLFTAGVFCTGTVAPKYQLNLAAILIGTSIAAVVGGQTGYYIGRTAGPPLFDRPDSRFFRHAWLMRVEYYLERYGVGKAILIARFVPIVRTLVNPFLGVLKVDQRRFAIFNAIGGVFWAVLVTMLGYALGESLPKGKSIDTYILPIIAAIIVISIIPIGLEVLRHRREGRSGGDA